MAQDRGRAAGAAEGVRGERQAARGAAAAHAHAVRPRDDERGRLLQRHRELLDAHRRSRATASRRSRCSTTSPTTSCSSSTRATSPCRSCTASSPATAAARTCSSTTGSACRRHATTGRCTFEEVLERINQCVFLSATPSAYELRVSSNGRRADRAPDRPRRPRGHRQAHQGPDRRPDGAGQRSRRQGRARAGHHAHQEDGRGPHRLPARAGPAGAVPALATSTRSSASRSCAACASATSTCSSASTCSARVSTCPRCRWCASSTPTRRASCAPRRR